MCVCIHIYIYTHKTPARMQTEPPARLRSCPANIPPEIRADGVDISMEDSSKRCPETNDDKTTYNKEAQNTTQIHKQKASGAPRTPSGWRCTTVARTQASRPEGHFCHMLEQHSFKHTEDDPRHGASTVAHGRPPEYARRILRVFLEEGLQHL